MPRSPAGQFRRLQRYHGIKRRAVVGFQGFPVRYGIVKIFAFRRMQTAAYVIEGGFVRRDQPALAPISIAMLHRVIRPSMLRSRIASPQNSTTWPVPPALPVLPMMASTISLAVCPAPLCPDFDFHGLRAALFQGLGRQHMLHFGGADTERQRTERAVGGGMESPHDRHPRQGNPCSGPMTWTMP